MLQSASRGVVSAPEGMGGCLVWGWGVPGLGGCLLPGGSAPRGCVYLVQGDGGVCSWGEGLLPWGVWVVGIPACTEAYTRPAPVDRHTLVKILPCPNFVAVGNYSQFCHHLLQISWIWEIHCVQVIRRSSLTLKPRAGVIGIPKQVYLWSHTKGLMSSKTFKKILN